MNKAGIKKLIRKGEERPGHPWAGMSDIELLQSAQLFQRDYQSGKEGFTLAANMLIHREFLNPYPAKFIIETHRLFAENSNKPHGHGLIDPANFFPFPKNPVIARFFKEIGRADELGSGVRNLFKYCRHYSGGKTPELIEEDVFKCIVPLTPQVTPQVTPQDERAQRILEFCQTPRTREEIQAFVKIKDREYFRKNFLQPLLKQGLLKPTIPDKPTSSKQKYYATKEKKIR